MTSPTSRITDHEAPEDGRQRLLDLWRGRLIEARKSYTQAAEELQASASSDGSQKMVNTLKAETQALDEYLRILRIFTDLVISGKAPEEQPAKGSEDGNDSTG